MNVHTYHEPLPGFNDYPVLEHWRETWTAQGWTCVVLGRDEAKAHPDYASYLAAVSTLPTINPKQYEIACYLRWLAIQTAGGGLMTDYDVMNYGFTPGMAAEHLIDDALIFFDQGVPSAVLGREPLFQRAADYLKNYRSSPVDLEGHRPHVSDMTVFQKAREASWIKHVPVVSHYGNPGWNKALLVHYSNASTGGNKLQAILVRP